MQLGIFVSLVTGLHTLLSAVSPMPPEETHTSLSVISSRNYRVPLFAFLLNWVSEKFMSKL